MSWFNPTLVLPLCFPNFSPLCHPTRRFRPLLPSDPPRINRQSSSSSVESESPNETLSSDPITSRWVLLSASFLALIPYCSKMGGVVGRSNSIRRSSPESKLEAKMVEAMQRRASEGTSVKSFNSIIMKFPKIDESLRKCKSIFEQFDEDSNGAIDQEELKHCFQKLEISFNEQEIGDLFLACDIDDNLGMKFNEFIVLLCLVYLLNEPAAVQALMFVFLDLLNFCFPTVSLLLLEICSDLETTFESLVDAFVFLDKNKDGYVSKNEMVHAINETTGGERSSGRIAMKRFEEMDWDKNGMVTFKEFLFAFTRWVGIDDVEDE
ncbi:EFh [Musa troglodytarum]|uniref:EFh n=1 Tax=Musa troglodytarum TaxID=320322 RepID=A0A9E7KGR5_9LILI|nr:EFh [Musa troglodytarum]